MWQRDAAAAGFVHCLPLSTCAPTLLCCRWKDCSSWASTAQRSSACWSRASGTPPLSRWAQTAQDGVTLCCARLQQHEDCTSGARQRRSVHAGDHAFLACTCTPPVSLPFAQTGCFSLGWCRELPSHYRCTGSRRLPPLLLALHCRRTTTAAPSPTFSASCSAVVPRELVRAPAARASLARACARHPTARSAGAAVQRRGVNVRTALLALCCAGEPALAARIAYACQQHHAAFIHSCPCLTHAPTPLTPHALLCAPA